MHVTRSSCEFLNRVKQNDIYIYITTLKSGRENKNQTEKLGMLSIRVIHHLGRKDWQGFQHSHSRLDRSGYQLVTQPRWDGKINKGRLVTG